jgi:hypothetical protein
MRNVINFLTHIEEDKEDVKYIKVVYDDINQLIELVESYGDTINSTRELYVASVSLQLNDTMKTLTIFSAILLPLTFVTSVYGMNGIDLRNFFEFPIGLAIVLVTMAAVTGGLFIFFKKKQWILAGKDPVVEPMQKEIDSNIKTNAFREVFDDNNARTKSNKKEHVDSHLNPSNRLAKRSADRIREGEEGEESDIE